MIVVRVKTVIGRPREQVFDFVASHFFENLGRWNPALLRIEQTSPGPITVGTTGREVQKIQGKEVGRNFKIQAFEPPQRFVVVNDGTEGVERHYRGTFELTAGSDGTELDYQFELDWDTPLFRFLPWLPRAFIRKDLRANMNRLKAALEAA